MRLPGGPPGVTARSICFILEIGVVKTVCSTKMPFSTRDVVPPGSSSVLEYSADINFSKWSVRRVDPTRIARAFMLLLMAVTCRAMMARIPMEKIDITIKISMRVNPFWKQVVAKGLGFGVRLQLP